MRWLPFVLSGFLAVLGPRPAWACTQVIGVFGSSPAAGTPTPASTQVLFGLAPGVEAFVADLHFREPRAPLRLQLEPFGAFHARLRIPITGDEAVRVELSMPGYPSERSFSLPLQLTDLDDLMPPTAPVIERMFRAWTDWDICYGPGTRISATLTPGADDWGVAGYALYEQVDAGSRIIAASLETVASSPDRRELFAFDSGPRRTDRRCFYAVTVDYAGHESAPSNVVCTDAMPPPPPIDAGVFDGGVFDSGIIPDTGPAPDATLLPDTGPAPDAGADRGAGGELAGANDGCRCIMPIPSFGAGTLLVLLFVLRLRRPRA